MYKNTTLDIPPVSRKILLYIYIYKLFILTEGMRLCMVSEWGVNP